MDNSIPQNQKNIKRYLPHKLETRVYAVEMYRKCGDIEYVCRKYHISRTSLWRWNKKYDGQKESLADKSHRPLRKHPTAHTEQEMKLGAAPPIIGPPKMILPSSTPSLTPPQASMTSRYSVPMGTSMFWGLAMASPSTVTRFVTSGMPVLTGLDFHADADVYALGRSQ